MTQRNKLQKKKPIKAEHIRAIEKIIEKGECPKGSECYTSELTNLCKAKDIGLEPVVECKEDEPRKCRFSLFFGYSFFCQCPLRIYISKKLGK